MRHKKQFVALSLAFVLVLGGALPASSPLGRVYAEEVQTEASADETDASSADAAAEPSDGAEVPSTDGAAAPETDATVTTTETGEDGVTLPVTDEVSVPTADEAEQTEELGSFSGNLISPELALRAINPANAVTGSVDLTSGLAVGQSYGDDVVKISVPTKMDYTDGNAKEVEGVNYPGWLRDPSMNGKVTLTDGTITAEGAIIVTSEKDAQISFVVQKASGKVIHFQHVENGKLVDFYTTNTDVPANAKYTYDINAGVTYYFYISGSRMSVGGISYVYEKDAEPVEMITKTQVVSVLDGLNKGTDYGKAGVIEITVSHNMKNEGNKTYIQAWKDDNSDKISGKVELNADGTVKTKEGLIEIKALAEGCTISIDITGKPADKKIVHFYHAEGTQLVDFFNDPDQPEYADDKTYTFELEKDVTYYFFVSGSKMSLEGLSYSYQEEKTTEDIELVDGVLAFPTAEGGGRLATGGRGGEIYHVTNLSDSGEGSLRYGIETVPAEGRIIVFDVGGTIHLQKTLSFKNHNNITIAGQTAPGDGITLAGYDTDLSNSDNIIIRFVRFRVGTENLLKGGDSMDALWGRDNTNFIIDHCTFSWNTDETLSTYRGKNGTVQWCLISESLTVSGHSKGRHGYGGIFGGDNTVFQYNLMTNHTSRNPRIGGGTLGDPGTLTLDAYNAMTAEQKADVENRIATLQLSNNVLYNHGYYACYGGGWTYTNYIYNYVKPGQGTRDSLVDTLLDFGENEKKGGVYYAGNILDGNAAVTEDNSKGTTVNKYGLTEVRATPYTAEAFDHISLNDEDTSYYGQVLNSAGATFPHRDAIDARVVAQVETNTGTYINTQDEVGGYPAENCESTLVDTDRDGIPDEWERTHGLDPNNGTDSRTLCMNGELGDETYGYAWIEVYFNEMVDENSKPDYVAENPEISIDLPDNKLLAQGESIKVTATATSSKGIEKVEFYNGAVLVGTATAAPYEWTYTPDAENGSIGADGTYCISARAYDNDGNKTQSNTSRLHVNSTAGIGEWSEKDIGNPGVAGTASLVDGVLTVKGAGKIGSSEGSNSKVRPELADSTDDDFHFVYQEMTGDLEIVTRFDSYLPVDNHTFQGLMFRSSLEDDAAMAALGFTMVKVDETTIWSAFMVDRAANGGSVQSISETIDSPEAAAKAGIPLIANLPFKEGNTYLGTWLKLAREGNTFIGSVSSDGLVWQKVGELTVELPDTVYVGFAVEANRAGNDLINYNTSKFSNIEINRAFANVTYDAENVNVAGSEKLAIGKDLAVTLSKVTGYVLPETVEVTIGGQLAVADVDYTYDSEKGLITIPNVQDDISISAYGVKRVVLPVEYEVVDEANLLTVTEEAGKLTLNQIATEGNMQTTDKNTSVKTDASNVSYLLFPEVDEYHQLIMDVTVKSVTSIGKGDANGFFLGAFATDGSGVYTTFGFRANMAGKGYWYKPNGDAIYTGDGNPGIYTGTNSNAVYTLDTTYHVEFVTDDKGGYWARVTWDGGSIDKQFKAGESVIRTGDAIRYGIAIIGAKVEISNMKLVDPEGNVIYNQNSADYSKVIEAIEKASGLNPDDYVDFSAVNAAWDAVDLGLDASHQAEVDAMAKAITDAITALEKKPDTPVTPDEPTTPVTPEQPGTSQIVKTEISNTISADALTDAVKEKTGCSTVEELVTYLKIAVEEKGYTSENSSVVEVTVMVSTDGINWVPATKDTMPKDGVDIVLPYPEGTNKNDYDFIVNHLITQGWNGQTAGTVEWPTVTKTDEGLSLHVMSASPFTVAWKQVANNEANDDDNSDDEGESGTEVTTAGVKTGDNMNVIAIIWSIVLLAVMAGAGVLVYSKRKENGTKSE